MTNELGPSEITLMNRIDQSQGSKCVTGYPHNHPHTWVVGLENRLKYEPFYGFSSSVVSKEPVKNFQNCGSRVRPTVTLVALFVPPSNTRETYTSIKIWATFDTTILSYYRDLTTVKVLSNKHMISSMFTF